MIELYEGVPGSGKSYHAICEKFLPWVKQGRRLYIAVDGIYLDPTFIVHGHRP
jgi:zona occludens toxin